MKKQILLVSLLLSVHANSWALNHQQTNIAGNGMISIDFGNGDVRQYVDARLCGGVQPPQPEKTHCLLRADAQKGLVSVSNGRNEVLNRDTKNETALNFIQRAVETGFCQLDSTDMCSFKPDSHFFDSCTPSFQTSSEFRINDLMIAFQSTWQSCDVDGRTREYGSKDYAQIVERSKNILTKICPNRDF